MKGLNYDIKILLAWAESIGGNAKITEWLMKNGYPELGLFHFAVRNEERSRKWLMDNKFPHLMALINGAEGKEEALKWLKDNGFEILHEIALVGDGDNHAFDRLVRNSQNVFAMIGKKIQQVKDDIEDKNNDFHRYTT